MSSPADCRYRAHKHGEHTTLTMPVSSSMSGMARSSGAMLVRGMVKSAEGAVSVMADRLQHLDLRIPSKSRDSR